MKTLGETMAAGPRSYFHRGGDLALLGTTIPEHFAAVVQGGGSREALVSRHQGRRLNYADLAAAAEEVARGLLGLGFGPGNRIGLAADNSLEWLLLQLAVSRIGAILVCINPAYGARELAYSLRHCEVQGLFTVPVFRRNGLAAILADLVPELRTFAGPELQAADFPYLRKVILYDPAAPEKTPRPHPGFHVWGEVLEAAAGVPRLRLEEIGAALDPDDPVALLYTSGSLGFPKTATLSHHSLLNNAWFAARGMRFCEQDRLCVPVPFFHCFGMVLANLLCLSVGGCLILPDGRFDPLSVLQAIEAERCTALHGVPTMFLAELEHPRFREFDLRTLRTGIMAGAPCPPELVRKVIEKMPCPEILIGYGMTETSPLTHLTSAEDSLERRTKTVGRNLPHQEAKVVDPETGRTVPLGQTGEICFRGYHLMRGYYGDPAATGAAIDGNGWLHSGDLGAMDAEGYLQITGRRKEIIIRGGENICPWQIEQFLLTHPKVAEAAVFGIPDPFFGEEIMAWIRLHPGQSAAAEEIRTFCCGQIAPFKIPKYIWFVPEFPLTATGKPLKVRMREIALEKMRAGDSRLPG